MGEIAEVAAELAAFAKDRDWEKFHLPRSLILALVGEVGELAEQVQWRTDDEIHDLVAEAPDLVGLELADIAIYLIRLADVLNIDLESDIRRKIELNMKRFPRSG